MKEGNPELKSFLSLRQNGTKNLIRADLNLYRRCSPWISQAISVCSIKTIKMQSFSQEQFIPPSPLTQGKLKL